MPKPYDEKLQKFRTTQEADIRQGRLIRLIPQKEERIKTTLQDLRNQSDRRVAILAGKLLAERTALSTQDAQFEAVKLVGEEIWAEGEEAKAEAERWLQGQLTTPLNVHETAELTRRSREEEERLEAIYQAEISAEQARLAEEPPSRTTVPERTMDPTMFHGRALPVLETDDMEEAGPAPTALDTLPPQERELASVIVDQAGIESRVHPLSPHRPPTTAHRMIGEAPHPANQTPIEPLAATPRRAATQNEVDTLVRRGPAPKERWHLNDKQKSVLWVLILVGVLVGGGGCLAWLVNKLSTSERPAAARVLNQTAPEITPAMQRAIDKAVATEVAAKTAEWEKRFTLRSEVRALIMSEVSTQLPPEQPAPPRPRPLRPRPLPDFDKGRQPDRPGLRYPFTTTRPRR